MCGLAAHPGAPRTHPDADGGPDRWRRGVKEGHGARISPTVCNELPDRGGWRSSGPGQGGPSRGRAPPFRRRSTADASGGMHFFLAPETCLSLSLIVPVAVASPSVAFAGLDSVSVKVSSSSSMESSVVVMLTVFDVSFAANVRVPDSAAKSVRLRVAEARRRPARTPVGFSCDARFLPATRREGSGPSTSATCRSSLPKNHSRSGYHPPCVRSRCRRGIRRPRFRWRRRGIRDRSPPDMCCKG